MKIIPTRAPLLISVPGYEILVNQMVPSVPLSVSEEPLYYNLQVLEMKGIDIILGMNWMAAQDAVIHVARRIVSLKISPRNRISLHLGEKFPAYTA